MEMERPWVVARGYRRHKKRDRYFATYHNTLLLHYGVLIPSSSQPAVYTLYENKKVYDKIKFKLKIITGVLNK